ncbi:MAG: tetrahydrofolate dehydrogenase/cyclohydrolase catalytic domain-containing protein, partial [Dehalococcoidia bacterium]
MTAQIIDGESIGAEIRAEVARRVEALKANGVNPGLAAILVGEDPGSIQYVGMKRADCAEAGILSETFELPATASESEVL